MPQNVLDTDEFTDANDTQLPTHNAKWHNFDVVQYENIRIQSNAASGFSESGDYNDGAIWTNDQWAEATISSLTGQLWMQVCVRTSGYGTKFDGYSGGVNNNVFADERYTLYKFTDGNFSILNSSAQIAQVGDVVNVEAVGTTITLRVNGIVVLQETDATWSGGNPGLFMRNGGGLDAWRAGSVTGATDPVVPKRQFNYMRIQY